MPHDRDDALIATTASVLAALVVATERNDRLAITEEIGRLLNALVVHRDAARPKDQALVAAIARL